MKALLNYPKKIFIFQKSIILLLFSFFFLSCINESTPTYSRDDIVNIIKNMCLNEFNIEVKVWEEENTIWVYAPFEDVITEKGEYRTEVVKDIDRIFLSLARTILSMDRRPDFYCFVVSDIKNGYDIYFVWYIPDFIKLQFDYISRGQFFERRLIIPFLNPAAIGDKEGKHLQPYNISLEEFVAYLIQQNLTGKFNSPPFKDKIEIKKLNIYYQNYRLTAEVDIRINEYEVINTDPEDEVKSMIKKFLKIYNEKAKITEIEIKDTIQTRLYSIEAFLKEN